MTPVEQADGGPAAVVQEWIDTPGFGQSSPVTIELDQPLGERALIDGLIVAPLGDLVPT